MKISTEAILTGVFRTADWDPAPMQLAIARIRDGEPLGELRDHPDVVAGVGGEAAIGALPSERGVKPSECWIIASARTAKTTLAVAGAIADLLSLDLGSLGPGEIPRVSITSVKLDTADVPYRKQRSSIRR